MEGDLVVMSMSHYSKLQLKLDLLGKLSVAQNQKADGDKGRTLNSYGKYQGQLMPADKFQIDFSKLRKKILQKS